MNRSAIISKDKKYRYRLSRIWSDSPTITYIMLNPSKADDQFDDKTIKRLIFFTKKFGFGGFYVGNLYPKITPYVNVLYDDLSHNKIENRRHIKFMINKSSKVVFAWGKTIESTPKWIHKIIEKPFCFGLNKNGTPKHPLYLKKNTSLIRFF